MTEYHWVWTQRCALTGETNDVTLTDAEKAEIERQPTFLGWEPGALRQID